MNQLEKGANQEVTLVRHLKDRDLLSGDFNDAPLAEGQEEKVSEIAQQILEVGSKSVDIIASPKRRTHETARLVSEHLYQNDESLSVRIRTDRRIRELDQGKYNLPSDYRENDYFAPLQFAWTAYFSETFNKTSPNWNYRFGDPLIDKGEYKYPELKDQFSEYGENQLEFSIRYYDFVVNLVQRLNTGNDVMTVVIGHQAVLARILEYASICADLADKDNASIPVIYPGTIPALEWEHLQREDVANKVKQLASPGELLVVDFSNIIHLSHFLEIERDVLTAIRMQRQ